MTLLLVVSILLLLSLPTNQMRVPAKKTLVSLGQELRVCERSLAAPNSSWIFLGLISWSFPTNHKIIVGIWAMIPFTVSPMLLLNFRETKGAVFKFLSFLIHSTPAVHFTDFASIVFKDRILQGARNLYAEML